MMLGLVVLPTRLINIFFWYIIYCSVIFICCYGFSFSFLWYVCVTQVAQVLLTLPYSFSQLGMLSGILFQLFYGLLGSWTAYLISILYVEYRTRKEREKVNFRSHVIQVITHLSYTFINFCSPVFTYHLSVCLVSQ
jgi:hypothetical protein